MPKNPDLKFYINVLESEECQCGKWKRVKMAFCYSCFKSLPGAMQRDLYRRLGDGFAENYEESAAWLRDKADRG